MHRVALLLALQVGHDQGVAVQAVRRLGPGRQVRLAFSGAVPHQGLHAGALVLNRLGIPGAVHKQITLRETRGDSVPMIEENTVSVDPDVAAAYRSSSDNDRRKLDLLVNLRLRDATTSGESLKQIMLDIGQNAQRRGLTPKILQSILDEK